jgi:chromosome condensin MukBEF ATPase and DNA-binding subunit MukB
MPFVMNQDIPETYEELKKAFIAECKDRYENNNVAIQLIREQGNEMKELKSEIANLEREKEAIEELAEEYSWAEEEVNRLKEENRVLKSYNYKLFQGEDDKQEEEEEDDLETKLQKVCDRIVIRPEDSLDHLIGKVPRTRKK